MGRLIFFIMGVGAIIYLWSTLLVGSSISDGDIEDLFAQRVELHNNLAADQGAMLNFIAYKMAPDFYYTSQTTVYQPGAEPRPLRANMDKKAYGNYILGTMASMAHYSFSNDIQDIKVDENGRTATVTYALKTTAQPANGPATAITATCVAHMFLHADNTLMFRDIACDGRMDVSGGTANPPPPPPPQ